MERGVFSTCRTRMPTGGQTSHQFLRYLNKVMGCLSDIIDLPFSPYCRSRSVALSGDITMLPERSSTYQPTNALQSHLSSPAVPRRYWSCCNSFQSRYCSSPVSELVVSTSDPPKFSCPQDVHLFITLLGYTCRNTQISFLSFRLVRRVWTVPKGLRIPIHLLYLRWPSVPGIPEAANQLPSAGH